MKKCLIFCAGGFDVLQVPPETGDFVLAADGGLAHLEKLGLRPQEILGDFDSLGYTPADARVFPVEKDDTDAMLAVRRGLGLGYREFHLYGALDGDRLDHTVANYQLLKFLSDRDAFGYLIGKNWIVTALKNGTLTVPAEAEGLISLFCMGPDAHGVTLRGLKYPLTGGTLTSGFPLGVSNHFTGAAASVTVEDGTLLVMWQRKTGLPKRSGQL